MGLRSAPRRMSGAPAPTDAELERLLCPEAAAWFESRFGGRFTPAQRLALPVIARRDNLLLASPTGSGKTLAAFLAILSDLHARATRGGLADGVHAVYVSPLKALAHDVARNLEAPLAGIRAHTPLRDDATAQEVRIAIRTGDTTRAERERMKRAPPHVLVTTPESAALVLASAPLRAHLGPLRWLVVDEVHALAGTKRGAHLSLTLERLARHAGAEPTRIGLSATVAPLDEVAGWLCGAHRPCVVLEAPPKRAPRIDIRLAPREDDVVDAIAEVVARGTTTIVFAPTRASTERLTRRLQERVGADAVEEGEEDDDDDDASVDPEFAAPASAPVVAPHHGSMSHASRLVVEERLKRQEMRCVVTSSSLELGVHLDGVDEVVLVGSPKSVARALQRVGRSAHSLEGVSRGTLLLRDVADVPEALALRRLMQERRVEEVRAPEAPLDVLAQHVAGLALEDAPVEAAFELARRAWPYRGLPRERWDAVLATLIDLVEVRGGRLAAAGPRTQRAVATQGGTIPDGGLVKAFHADRYVGELDEAFVATLAPGDTLQLAGETWRFVGPRGTSALLEPSRGRHPTVPEWRAEGLGASGLLMDATAQEDAHQRLRNGKSETTETESQFTPPGDELSKLGQASHVEAEILSAHSRLVAAQARFSALPGPFAVENVVDDSGRRALVFHLAAGRRANEALARVLALRLGQDAEPGGARSTACDQGFTIFVPRSARPSLARLTRLFQTPLDADLRGALLHSELLRRRFRHVAFRALALRKDVIPPMERQRAANALLSRLLRDDAAHPALEEAWREVLHEALDARAAEAVRERVAAGTLVLDMLPARPHASPLGARILVRDQDERRAERLRDHDERVEEWLAKERG